MTDSPPPEDNKKTVSMDCMKYILKKVVSDVLDEKLEPIFQFMKVTNVPTYTEADLHVEIARIRQAKDYKTIVLPLVQQMCRKYLVVGGHSLVKQDTDALDDAISAIREKKAGISYAVARALIQQYLKNAKPEDDDSISEETKPDTSASRSNGKVVKKNIGNPGTSASSSNSKLLKKNKLCIVI